MGRAYNVTDSDGHVLEPLNLWENYIDPGFRDRTPRLFIDKDEGASAHRRPESKHGVMADGALAFYGMN